MSELLSQFQTVKTVFWEISGDCNLRCKHCYADKYLTSNAKHELSKLEIAELLLEWGPDIIIILGGEPLLEPKIVDIIDFFSNTPTNVSITTNATLLDEDTLLKLLSAGIHSFSISLDGGTAKINDAIRGIGVFNKVMRSLETCLKINISNRLRISHCVGLHNYHDFKNVCTIARDYDIKYIVTSFIFGSSKVARQYRPKCDQAYNILEDLAEISSQFPGLTCAVPAMPLLVQYLNKKYSAQLTSRIFKCEPPHGQLLVTINGEILPCGAVRGMDFPIASVIGDSRLGDILKTPLMHKFAILKDISLSKIPMVCNRCYYRQWCCMRCPLTLNNETSFGNYHDCEIALLKGLKDGIQIDYMPRDGLSIPLVAVQ